MVEIKDLGEVFEADVLVIGGGLAGAFAAIKAKVAGAEKVLLLDKAKAGKSGCSIFAAGVFHGFIPDEDDRDVWFREIVHQGEFMNDQEWLEIMLQDVYPRVRDMEEWGVKFLKTPEGKYERMVARGGGEGGLIKIIMFAGPVMMEMVAKRAKDLGVEVMDRVMVTDLIIQEGRVVGAVGFDDQRGDFKIFKAKATVQAAGGTAYKSLFANHKTQTGDGQAMAYRAGAECISCDFATHHSSAAAFDILGMNMFVALGGIFVNSQGERFLHHYDPIMGDRTLMHRYSQAMALEVVAGRGPIYLDMTHFSPEDVAKLKEVLPLISKNLEIAGILGKDKILKKMEWVSVNFGTIGMGGGIRINTRCETTLPGLFACGDAANGAPAGAEGYGAAALPFACVSGARAGEFAAAYAKGVGDVKIDEEQVERLKRYAMAPLEKKDGIEPDQVVLALQEAVLTRDVFIIMREDRLKKALEEVEEIASNQIPLLYAYDPHYLRMAHEAQNMILCARMWLTSAIERKESRGSVLREDYPETDNVNWLKWITVRDEKGNIKVRIEDIPMERYKLEPKIQRQLHPTWEAARKRGIKWE